MNETNQAPSTGGTKLSTIFMVVLGLHVVVIAVILAFYLMKGRGHNEMADTATPAATETIPALADGNQTSANPSAEPVVETAAAPIISSEMIDTMAGNEQTSPMPAASDPVWSTPRSDMTEPSESPENLATTDSLQTPPARLEMEPRTLPASSKKAPVTTAATTSKAKTYQVAPGDNLTKIAKKNSTTVAKLKQANGLSTDSLKVGQVLKVPGFTVAGKTGTVAATNTDKAPAKKPAPIVAAAASTPAQSSSYQVAPGDNLTKIAKKNSTTVAKLKQANGLSTDSLKVGQILKVPGSAATKASPKAAPVREADASTPSKKPFREPVITMDMARL